MDINNDTATADFGAAADLGVNSAALLLLLTRSSDDTTNNSVATATPDMQDDDDDDDDQQQLHSDSEFSRIQTAAASTGRRGRIKPILPSSASSLSRQLPVSDSLSALPSAAVAKLEPKANYKHKFEYQNRFAIFYTKEIELNIRKNVFENCTLHDLTTHIHCTFGTSIYYDSKHSEYLLPAFFITGGVHKVCAAVLRMCVLDIPFNSFRMMPYIQKRMYIVW